MTTEVANIAASSLELLPPAQPPSANARQMLICHAEMMQTAHQLAAAMVGTEMVPTRFRNKADDAAAAILYGAELGLNPIQSLQRIIPIYGMPTLEARTMVALLKSRGYKIRTVAQSDESVTVWGQDLGGDEYESTWTIERALKAGYVPTVDEKTGKYRANSKGNLIGNEKYISDPQAMLKAKAQAEVCRDMAPDVLLGISYTSEELQSERFDDAPPAPKQQPRSAPLTVLEIFNETPTQRPADSQESGGEAIPERQQALADAHTQLDADSDEVQTEQTDAAVDEPNGPASREQNRRINEMFDDAGLDKSKRDDRLTVIGSVLGYKLDPTAKLTRAEAQKLLMQLSTWQHDNKLVHEVTEILNAATLAAENQPTEKQEN